MTAHSRVQRWSSDAFVVRQELGAVYANAGLNPKEELLVVPVFQKSAVDLSHWGDEEAKEKDRLLEQFVLWANAVREHVTSAGHWLNFTDPASGYPVHGDRGGMTCNDVDVCLLCVKFPTVDLGVCKIMSHPEWKTAVYPTTMVTTAPFDILTRALEAEQT